MLKFTLAQLTALECKTHEEAADKVVALFGNFKTQAETITGLQAKLTASTESNTGLVTALAASDKKILALETTLGDPKAMTESRIGEIAKAKGSEAAMQAISGTGTGSPVAPASAVNGTTTVSESKRLETEGKFEEQWKADKNIQAEFPNAKGYAAFMRAQAAGTVRIVSR